ncbi:MAG: ATP-binding protein [Candidatus Thorarchaeota archaeon]
MEQEVIQDIYRQFQHYLDEHLAIRFPPSKSGAEIRFLKHLFTPEEVELAMNLSVLPEPVDRIFNRVKESGMSSKELGRKLDTLVQKGAIMGGELTVGKNGEKQYCLAPFKLGMFEFLNFYKTLPITKDVLEAAYEYGDETFYKEFFKKDVPSQIRTIPVEKSVTPEHHISTYDNIKQIVENLEGPIAVAKCVCRESMDVLGHPCSASDRRETCFAFEKMAKEALKSWDAREITKSEMLELLDEFQELGFILRPENNQNPTWLCSCCGDCCGNLRMVRQFSRPAEYFTSNFYAEVNPELCEGCETCVNLCQMHALTIENKHSTVNLDLCIGCGICAANCENGAISLIKKEKEIVPPKDQGAMYQKIMMKEKGLGGTLKMMGKMLLKKKI